ncbi:MAG: hypothetical protein EA355_13375 [Rhodobacteraceae bacterium]|nr:MAG: hypothetical protein EA355_13375 [Paracoccaceae bacterium]
MSGPRDRESVLAERLDVVLAIGAANAARQRAQAAWGGAQIEAMGAAEGKAHERRAAEAAETAAQSALDHADAEIEALERRLAALDAELVDADR